MSPLISVIVPIYNVEPYLRQCLDSIIRQSYTNLEIILINDGSTDNSGAIADEYARLDSRIKVIHQENGGLAAARNSGIEIMSGDFVSFVDSDDWLELDMYEEVIPILCQNKHLSLVKFGTIKKAKHLRNRGSSTIREYEGLKGYLRSKAGGVVWNALYRREAIKDIRFVPGYVCEDIYFTHKLLSQEGIRFVHYDRRFYHYRTSRPGSIMAGKRLQRKQDEGHLWEVLLSETKGNQLPYLNLAYIIYIRTAELLLMRDLNKTPESEREAFATPFRQLLRRAKDNSDTCPIASDWSFFWLMLYIKTPHLFWLLRHPILYFKFKDYLVQK